MNMLDDDGTALGFRYDENAYSSSQTVNTAQVDIALVSRGMVAPAVSRRPRAPTIPEDKWKEHKKLIYRMHVVENQSLPVVMAHLEKEYSFVAT